VSTKRHDYLHLLTYILLESPTKLSHSSLVMSWPLWSACQDSCSLAHSGYFDHLLPLRRRNRKPSAASVKEIAVTSHVGQLTVQRLCGSNPQISVFH